MDSAHLGLIMWVTLFTLSWWARRRTLRKAPVSRNTRARHDGTGKWEQVAPMDECFDDLEDDW